MASTTLRQLSKIPIKYPLSFGITISTAKTSFSDLLVQKVVEQREEIDWRRNAAFATFGCFYLGGVQYALYVPIFGRIFPNAASFAAKSLKDKVKDVKGMAACLGQVFLDQMVHHPLFYFPAFYCTKEIVVSNNPDFGRVLREYRANMMEDLLALWKIWVPSTLVNFAFMPMWGRIPWVAGTSLLWTCILSAMRGGDVAHSEDLVGGNVTGATMKIINESIGEKFYTCPADLDPTLSHVCVSASGPDRVGWVSLLAKSIEEGGGNVTHSKMVRLGQEFTVLMHVSVSPEKHRQLVRLLRDEQDLEELNVKISSLTRRETGLYARPTLGIRIHCVGEDRPGMLAKIASIISEKNLSVEDLTTELRYNKQNGRRDFVVNVDCTSQEIELKDEDKLHAILGDLETLKGDLGLEILDIRVHQELS